MYVDDLIKELESWKAPEAEVTVNGADISRVTAASKGDRLEIVTDYLMNDDEREDLENEILELRNSLEWRDEDVEDLKDQIDDLKWSLERAIPLLERYLHGEPLDNENSRESDNIIRLIKDAKYEVDREYSVND